MARTGLPTVPSLKSVMQYAEASDRLSELLRRLGDVKAKRSELNELWKSMEDPSHVPAAAEKLIADGELPASREQVAEQWRALGPEERGLEEAVRIYRGREHAQARAAATAEILAQVRPDYAAACRRAVTAAVPLLDAIAEVEAYIPALRSESITPDGLPVAPTGFARLYVEGLVNWTRENFGAG